ncbi:rhodanese-like domain-containing protein [Zobellella maritima]|uniref:rhodanese-like domain-containing protein n=1 Tax=Zobellella maritima TaxID=2059725 RepID=UPI000E306363|nr:rhodanese-like domain-containing protein [Zobellella maritima]
MYSWISALLLLTLSSLAWAGDEIWIDVRSTEEYQQEHLVGAIHIPHTQIAKGVSKRFPDRDTPLNLYCRSGRRSQLATEALQALGYTQVVNRGGLDQLKQGGMPTEGNQVNPEALTAQP